MVREALELLDARPGKLIIDATVGGGGHAAAVLEKTAPDGRLIGIDQDADAIEAAGKRLLPYGARATIIYGKMSGLKTVLENLGIKIVDGIIADLGVSSAQFDNAERGFSFRMSAPLDMRMDKTIGESAEEVIARLDEKELTKIIKEYGEERFAARIARAIVAKKIKTTGDLAAVVKDAVPAYARHLKIHPATRTFQALRIFVNNELLELESFLESAPGLLNVGGRLVVISYHSLEDRRVKHSFRHLAAEGNYFQPVRRALKPCDEEVSLNPRARSAKMRVLERVK